VRPRGAYLRAGVDRGEAVLAVVSAGVQQILRSALGDDATRVQVAGR
jgi:hypothetical protein